jgi:hypothetical protein
LLKNAKIVPVFKTGNSGMLGNYRPISLLPIVNKILEKLIYVRLESFFQSCSTISCNQFGFRKNKDTTQATLKIIDTAIGGLDSDVCSACIFLDYSKAFDTVCHSLLLSKLERYGVRGHALALMSSYLLDRKHYVYVNGSSSDVLPLKVGVPQGSCLGPLLYLLYTNDINYLLKDTNVVLFADDTALVERNASPKLLLYSLSCYLNMILDWSNYNKLSINLKKTKWIFFTNRKVLIPKLYLNDIEIENVRSFKYLGFHMDERLNYKTHVKYIKTRLSRVKYLSRRIRPYLTIESARCIYYGLVHSIVSYGLLVWGGVFLEGASASRLCGLQDKIIFNLFSDSHETMEDVTCIYKRMNILKFVDLYKVKICVFIYKVLNEDYVPFLYDVLEGNAREHHYDIRNPNDYLPPFPVVKAVKQNFMYRGICAWNDLDRDFKLLPSSNSLKLKYTKQLLNLYSDL